MKTPVRRSPFSMIFTVGGRKLRQSFLIATSCIGLISQGQSATTWVNSPTDTLWTTVSNWTNGVPASTATATAAAAVGTVTFGNTATPLSNITDISGDKAVQGIVFTGSANFTTNSSSGVLYLYDGGIDVQGGTQIFGSAQVRLRGSSGNVTIANNGTALNFNSGLWVHRESAGTTNLTFSGTGTTTVSTFARRSSGDDINIIKNDSGTLTISSSNTGEIDSASGRAIKGTTTINGGKIRINNEANLGSGPVAFNAAALNLNGGALSAFGTFAIDDATRGITVGANGGTLDAENTFTMTVANVVTGAGSLSKTGAGDVVLSATNTYTGATNVSTGKLSLVSSTANNIASSVRVNVQSGATFDVSGVTAIGGFVAASGQTLAGTGTIAGKTTLGSGSFLRAGNSDGAAAGTLTFSTDLSLNAGSTSAFQLTTADATFASASALAALTDPATLGGTDDFVNVTGTFATLAGSTIALDFTGYLPQYGDVFDLFDAGTFDIAAGNVPTFTITGGSLGAFALDTSRFRDLGIIAIVPEPSRLLLLAAAMLGFVMRRRR